MVIYPRCTGLDVHKQTVVACARIVTDGSASQQVRTFETTTSGLLALADWLESFGVQHMEMEATGVYWKPVWHILESHFELILANAANVNNVPERLAACVTTRVKASPEELLEALRGRIRKYHRFMLKLHLGHIDALNKAIADIGKEVGLGLEPFRAAAKLLTSMPDISTVVADAFIAEISIDVGRFATPGHLLSWVRLCPRNDESVGKRRSTRFRRGGKWFKTTLVQAAWAAVRVKGGYL